MPYYLLFEPRGPEADGFRLSGKKYVAVKPNADGRLEIPPLKLEVAIRDGWVRFWFEGELLPLPGDLLKERDGPKAEIEKAEGGTCYAEGCSKELTMSQILADAEFTQLATASGPATEALERLKAARNGAH